MIRCTIKKYFKIDKYNIYGKKLIILSRVKMLMLFEQLFFFNILFIHERHTEKGRDTGRGRGRSRLHARSLMVGLDPGSQNHALS